MSANIPEPLVRTSSVGPRTPSVMLYNGVSNRSRGWKSKRLGEFGSGDSRLSRQPSLRKFDGAARSSYEWDNLRRDPDLWFRNGNCYVHLYEKGQSQRGPALKVPFSGLSSAHCQPLIEGCIDGAVSDETRQSEERVDMYIPAPPSASRSEALQYHIATRNFFAFIFRRSMVGSHLGCALVGLMESMDKFRGPEANNIEDLLSYLDEEGYLDLRYQPDYSLAILRLAEAFQIKDLYIDALAHCVGMSECLHMYHEYPRISISSRRLIRQARTDLDFRLGRAGAMMGDLLQEELSETYLGLSSGARMHLDRFRAYVQGFYVDKFGSFPTPSWDTRCSTIFQPEVYFTMKQDFKALYEYLVNEKFINTDHMPYMAQGGLCTLQTVLEFDSRHKFTPLYHPLPLLPEETKAPGSRRRRMSMAWLVGNGKTRQGKAQSDQRLLAHAALVRATNRSKLHLSRNDFVSAYRKFEEDSAMMHPKGERAANSSVSPANARKVRWVFVYAMYQTLRSCTEIPSEVKMTDKVGYHLGISTEGLPPWEFQDAIRACPSFDGRDSHRTQHCHLGRGNTNSAIPMLSSAPTTMHREPEPSFSVDIKPDIDYFALNHPEKMQPGRPSRDGASISPPPSRTQSLTRRSLSLRRSLNVFRPSSSQRPATADAHSRPQSRQSTHHEIVIQGYGNGTNKTGNPFLKLQDGRKPPRLSVLTSLPTGRSASTSSTSSYSSAVSKLTTTNQSDDTSSATLTNISPCTPSFRRQISDSWKSSSTLVADAMTEHFMLDANPLFSGPGAAEQHHPYDSRSFPVRKQSTRKSLRNMYSHDDMLAAAPMLEPAPPPLPRRSSRRFRVAEGGRRLSMLDISAALREKDSDNDDDDSEPEDLLQPRPLRIRKGDEQQQQQRGLADVDEDGWEMTMGCGGSLLVGDVSPPPCGWEQFTDLGGLQPMHLLK